MPTLYPNKAPGRCAAVVVATILLLGCGGLIEFAVDGDSRDAMRADEPATPPASDDQIPDTASDSPLPAAAYPINLSAGTALPQTLPTGTAVGFSVDYQWVEGDPAADAVYLWEIKDRQGQSVQAQVELRPSGTLQGFFDVRPEQGPFQSRLVQVSDPDASSGEPLSGWQEMR